MFRFFKQLLAFFGVHQMALSLFRFIAALGRTEVVANTLGTFTLLLVFVMGGFIVARGKNKILFLFNGVSFLVKLLHLMIYALVCSGFNPIYILISDWIFLSHLIYKINL